MNLIPIIPYRQWTGYSCSAAVLSMVVRHFTGRRVPHLAAIIATRCCPNGCSMAKLRKVLRKYGLKSRVIPVGVRSFRRELDSGRLVVADDNVTYTESHVAVVHGHTRKRFWIVDPIIGLPTLRNCKRVIRAAEDAFAVWR